jgi:hypothetical protein
LEEVVLKRRIEVVLNVYVYLRNGPRLRLRLIRLPLLDKDLTRILCPGVCIHSPLSPEVEAR